MAEDEICNKVDLLKKAFPKLNDDAVKRALQEIAYMESFPEDMVESRTRWDELYNTMSILRNGFSALYDAVRRVAGKESRCRRRRRQEA